jgi:N-acetylmuramate 1-kinase
MPQNSSSESVKTPELPLQDDARLGMAREWLESLAETLAKKGYSVQVASLRAASSDASFRRYFRLDSEAGPAISSLILMDAPPQHEDIRPFVHVATLLSRAGLNVPGIIEVDYSRGFMLCTDLGNSTYLSILKDVGPSLDPTPEQDSLYQDAWQALIAMQAIAPSTTGLPSYSEAKLDQEMRLFNDWYLEKHLNVQLENSEADQLNRVLQVINERCRAQPQVVVHRDYHSRNLMRCEPQRPGILDFQDAVIGPITYDLVSLLRDAYIEWPEEVQIDWAVRYWQDARKAGLPVSADFADFWKDFEWMGLQRHLKVLGIFARLAHRDGKTGYLADLPLVGRYAFQVARRYQGLGPLAKRLERCLA